MMMLMITEISIAPILCFKTKEFSVLQSKR